MINFQNYKMLPVVCIRNTNIRIWSLFFIFIFSLGIVSFFPSHGQTYDPFIQSQVDELTYDSLYARLLSFENLGIKQAGSAALDNTRDWIVDLYQQWGYTDIEFDSFNYGQHLVHNIIITKTGTLFPNTYLIVDGHYDTFGGPGVNDNGSGTAIVLETARLMKDVETKYSIKFIHFTVEEAGLVGSTHYVENTVIPQNLDIRLVFNIDEVGGVTGEVNNTITCERDEWAPAQNNAASAAFTDTLVNLTEMYSSLNTSINYAYGSDYVPFMNNGYVVTGYYEYNESPYPHGPNDILSNLDPEYVFELSKAALGSTMYFSGALDVNVGISAPDKNFSDFHVVPNPFDTFFEVENPKGAVGILEVFDLQGNVRAVFSLGPEKNTRFNANLPTGIYFYRVLIDHQLHYAGKLIRK